ncbi:protein phosphatase 1 regulatory subunit 14C-like [Lampetra fluviatilis]
MASGGTDTDTGPGRVLFEAAGSHQEAHPEQRRPWKVTVKYDRKELQKRLELEEWMETQLGQLFPGGEADVPDLEIDVEELLELDEDEDKAKKLRAILQGCSKNPEGFIRELLQRLKSVRKLSTPQKK